ncbi:hypothetical protein BS17DRAFT_535594 [Gyrodon lividus]|nr:hypothetical protein BS17DRAFT_535594 [Gyrodon lividus]
MATNRIEAGNADAFMINSRSVVRHQDLMANSSGIRFASVASALHRKISYLLLQKFFRSIRKARMSINCFIGPYWTSVTLVFVGRDGSFGWCIGLTTSWPKFKPLSSLALFNSRGPRRRVGNTPDPVLFHVYQSLLPLISVALCFSDTGRKKTG